MGDIFVNGNTQMIDFKTKIPFNKKTNPTIDDNLQRKSPSKKYQENFLNISKSVASSDLSNVKSGNISRNSSNDKIPEIKYINNDELIKISNKSTTKKSQSDDSSIFNYTNTIMPDSLNIKNSEFFCDFEKDKKNLQTNFIQPETQMMGNNNEKSYHHDLMVATKKSVNNDTFKFDINFNIDEINNRMQGLSSQSNSKFETEDNSIRMDYPGNMQDFQNVQNIGDYNNINPPTKQQLITKDIMEFNLSDDEPENIQVTINKRPEALKGFDQNNPDYQVSDYSQLEDSKMKLEKKIGESFFEIYAKLEDLKDELDDDNIKDDLLADSDKLVEVIGYNPNELSEKMKEYIRKLFKLLVIEQIIEESEKYNLARETIRPK